MHFYGLVLADLLRKGVMQRTDSVLAVCASGTDAQVLREVGISRAIISNLDKQASEGCAPFDWLFQDVEQMTLADGSIDWVVVHGGLHHCASPHRALLEMCRVARKGAIAIEARDSLLMRAAVRIGLTSAYEIEAVVLEGYRSGGWRNGPVPNYVYRWTEREVVKTIESAFPHRWNDIRFFYGLELPTQRLSMAGGARRAVAAILGVVARGVQQVLPRQCNRFGFAIMAGTTKPWIERRDDILQMRRDFPLKFNPAKYMRPSSN